MRAELARSPAFDIGVPAARVAKALAHYWDNVDHAAHWVHSSWIAASLGIPDARLQDWRALLEGAPSGVAARCSRALVRMLDVTPPGCSELSQGGFVHAGTVIGLEPNACLLDVVPAPQAMRIWRMRALLWRRDEVRRLIDRHERARLVDWTGLDMDVMMRGQNIDWANDATRLVAAAMPPLGLMNASSLAIEGMLLMLRDLKGSRGLPFPLSRLALPRYIDVPAWIKALPAHCDEAGTERLFRRLPELLGEWVWLFG
ncbi:hypothetical protein WT83_16455 [Burkholderia territorii]|uniref:Type III secretion protein HrpB4 n=1 Tax=Burkholderia territorii TaxID=1503055 RepID=A0A108ENQ4_9BURK|nr:type III secretion protein HrpB4 [Burkholderia territorii]KWN14685.1 hypothetical protein WT83_16455 [Burkholderia territorii]